MRYQVIEPFKRGNKVYRDGEIWLTELEAQPLVAAGLIVADPHPVEAPGAAIWPQDPAPGAKVIAADPVEAPDATPAESAPVVPAAAPKSPAATAADPAPAAVPAEQPAAEPAAAPAPAPRRRRSAA
jgi:hypothetical protein